MGFSFSHNTGKLLENLVFLALRRQTRDLFYLSTPGGYEVDFYLPETHQLIQVAQHLENPPTGEREVRALQDAVKAVKVEGAVLLTDASEETFDVSCVPVQVRSVTEWLLQE